MYLSIVYVAVHFFPKTNTGFIFVRDSAGQAYLHNRQFELADNKLATLFDRVVETKLISPEHWVKSTGSNGNPTGVFTHLNLEV